MKKRILKGLSVVISAVSLVVIYDKFFNKSKIEKAFLNSRSVEFATNKITHRDHHSHERFLRENPLAMVLFLVFVFMLVFHGGMEKYLQYFQTAMIQTQYQTEPFDGAVYPVEKVPKWTLLTDAERTYNYSQIPASKFMSLPAYNPSDFRKGLTWERDNERERNAYITYPVPNMGNYMLDGTENSGSHTGVDIKLPTGTPIKSISHGVVIKAENAKTNFGKHIVVMHTQVPNPQNPAKKTTLFSAYAHLSQIKVKEGEQVKKGQIIGLSGATGMATAPHLHFQVDTADAPFHPYWPIAWSDVVSSGLNSFFDAVKHGVNSSLGRKYTVHPMNLVSRNISYTPIKSVRIVAEAGTTAKEIAESSTQSPPKTESKIKNEGKKITTSIKKTEAVNTKPKTPIRLNSRRKYSLYKEVVPVQNNRVRIASRTPSTRTTTLHASAEKESITASVTTKITENSAKKNNISEIKKEELEKVEETPLTISGDEEVWFESSRSFVPGVANSARLFVKNLDLIPSGGVVLTSAARDFVKIIPVVAKAEAFKNGHLEITIIPSSEDPFKIEAQLKNKKIETETFLPQPFRDISSIGKDRLAAQYVKEKGIMKGYANGQFKPNKSLNRAEAVKIVLEAMSSRLIPAKNDFSDVQLSDWFASYVSTAVENGVIAGYKGGVFKPSNTMNKAEFLKIVLEAKGVSLSDNNFAPYRDVPADSWYEKYFSFARNNGLISPDTKGKVYPALPINRIEAAYILYKLSSL